MHVVTCSIADAQQGGSRNSDQAVQAARLEGNLCRIHPKDQEADKKEQQI